MARMCNNTPAFTLCFLLTLSLAGAQDPGLVVHEWGTFTTLQNEQGRELNAINIDDEPVPEFVHNLSPRLLSPTFLTDYQRTRMKGLPRRHPHVSMRLETPVVYFYPPADTPEPLVVDVSVRFRGGWLTEFYPDARADAPGLGRGFDFGELERSTVSSLRWDRLRVGTEGRGPETSAHVWTTPRLDEAAAVTTAAGQSEGYLFYRGVANQRAPLRVVTDGDTGRASLHANFGELSVLGEVRVRGAWLVDVDDAGLVAYRTQPAFTVTGDEVPVVARVETSFAAEDFRAGNLDRLRREMQRELVADGLFENEAAAMLATWNRAYFESAGQRLFFVVPRQWTDHYLPLEIPAAASIERVMMARIELVTPRQRQLLEAIANGGIENGRWVHSIPHSEARDRFLKGRIDFGDLGVEIPASYQRYLDLGRFRTALVIDRERREPTEALSAFVQAYGLQAYRWDESEGN